MSKIVTDFLNEVKEQKVKQLLGISLDKKYWTSVIGDKDIDVLRKELGEEQKKIVKNKNGTVHSDTRNMDRINELNVLINALEKATTELARLNEMEGSIKSYMAFVVEPSKEALVDLEVIAKL